MKTIDSDALTLVVGGSPLKAFKAGVTGSYLNNAESAGHFMAYPRVGQIGDSMANAAYACCQVGRVIVGLPLKKD